MTTCDYCKQDVEGLPHRCKYCGQTHCSKHLLPESHDCEGLKRYKEKNPERWRNAVTQSYKMPTPKYSHRSSWRSRRSHRPRRSYSEKKFSIPSLRMPRIRVHKILKVFLFALVTLYLAFTFQSDILLILEFGVWSYFSFLFYKKAFRWANSASMADDLSFFGMRIVGAVCSVVSVWIGFAVFLSTLFVKNSLPIKIPFITFLAGLFFLGAFIAFRTNRRHHVVGVWRA